MTDELAATPDVPPEQPAGAVHWHRDTSWDDLEVKELPNGVRSRGFVIDSGDDRDAPTVFWSYFPPHTVTAPHSHQCDYAEIILHGSQQVTRRWYKAGDVRIVKAGTVYGPLVAGPEGATVIVIFRHSNWEPVPARQSDTDGLFVGEIGRMLDMGLLMGAVLFFVALVAIFYRIFVDIDIKALSLLAEACTLVDI